MNKIVLITGGTSGYGLATARKFRDEGDMVIIASRNAEKVARVVQENNFAAGFKLDVTCYKEWEALQQRIKEQYGRIDVLVNNAGGGVKIVDTVDQTAEDIDHSIALNLNSVIYGSKLFGAMMKEQKDGIIINISSVCATHCWDKFSVYAAAKAGVLNFTKGFYVEMRPYGVRATCIIPASAKTDFLASAGIPEEGQVFSLQPEDIANAAFFAANQPKGVVVEDMTVWGTLQEVNPL